VSYWLHPDAEAELGDAVMYYAEQASTVIATAFLAEFESVMELLVENQQRGPHYEDGLRVYHFKRFPYSVIYEDDSARGPQVFAVAHQRREPRYWLERI
jgi:plasmid stabilization system protein ParE